MKIFFLRVALTIPLFVFFYHEGLIAKCLACLIFAVGCLLSYQRFYTTVRERIFSLLADKILFTTMMVALVDHEILHVGLVVWVIGSVFIYSGVDLLQRSLQENSSTFIASWIKNLVYMSFVFFFLSFSSFQNGISIEKYQKILSFVCHLWVWVSTFFIIQCLFSKSLKELTKEA